MRTRFFNAASAPQPQAAYSQAVEVTAATRTLYLSGQLGINADGSFPPGAAEQAELAWRSVGAQLAEAGLSFKHIVKLTIILSDRADLPAVRPARDAAMGTHRPASTVLIAGLVNPAWKIEIEAIAYR